MPGEPFDVLCEAGILGHAGTEGEPGLVGCTYRGLARDVRPGERLLLDDGALELEVLGVRGSRVSTEVRVGGLLRAHKGINLPGTAVRAPSLSGKDLADLECAIGARVDLVALSFVRSARGRREAPGEDRRPRG